MVIKSCANHVISVKTNLCVVRAGYIVISGHITN